MNTLVLGLLLVGALALIVTTLRAVPAQPAPAVTEHMLALDFTLDERARERAFRARVRPWTLAGVALDVVVPTALVVTGIAARVASTVTAWWVGAALAVTLVLVASRLVTLPGAVVVRREAVAVGLAAGSWARWWRDVALAWALGWLLATVAMVAWVGALHLWPSLWWVVVALAAAVLVVVMSFVLPVVVEPLFARFVSMPPGALRDDLLALAARDGVEVGDVLVADASRRTTALNAYVSGLGRTRRVVVHDTLLARGRDDEVRAVVAHELGHVVAHDVRTGTLLAAGGAVLGVLAASVLLSSATVLSLAHLSGSSDPAVAALLIALGAWAGLLGAPVSNAVSRRIERRADVHGLELLRDPATVARMQRSLAVTNLAALRPPRLLQWWWGTHPTSPERIAAARAWGARRGVDVPASLLEP